MTTQTRQERWRRRSVRSERDDGGVQRLMNAFGKSLTAGDGKAIAAMWEVPALVMADQESHAVSSAQEIEQFFGGAKEQYNSKGITDTRPDILAIDWLTERIAIVDVRWPWLNAEGKELGDEASTYVLHRGESGELKIQAVIMRGAGSQPPN